MVLREAFGTKVTVGDEKLGFDHEYPPEVVKKRKDYVPMKKLLNEKGIVFQSPYMKLKVHWPEGMKIQYMEVQKWRASLGREAIWTIRQSRNIVLT